MKVVLFLSPELELAVSESVRSHIDWDCTIYSTGPNRVEWLTDVSKLTEILKGADICFISTTTDFTAEKNVEVSEGLAIAEACKRACVPNVILSAHIHCEKTIGVPAKHYDAKAEVYQYIRNTLQIPVTMLNIPPLYEMFFDFLCPKINAEGNYELVFPAVGPASIDFISLKDVGSCLLTILENPKVFESKTVALSGDKLTGKIVTKILNDELYPMKFVQKQVTVQQVRERPFVGSIDIANMFELLGRADLKASPSGTRELSSHVLDLKAWVRLNKDFLVKASNENTEAEKHFVIVV